MEGSALLIFALGAGAAGFISGLTGLGASLVALAFWLHVISPQVAIPMAAAIGASAQIISLGFLRRGLSMRKVWPFLIGGIIGLPIGVSALSLLNAELAKAGIGALLVVYCLYGLTAKQPTIIRWGGRHTDGAVGFLGGLMGGLASIPGPLPAIWSGLRGWTKDEQRGVIQIFNLVMLGFAVLAHNVNGRFETLALSTAAIALGCASLGCLIGIAVYHRTSERNFRRIVLILLLVSGLSHLGSALF